jgi:hypothetical protein
MGNTNTTEEVNVRNMYAVITEYEAGIDFNGEIAKTHGMKDFLSSAFTTLYGKFFLAINVGTTVDWVISCLDQIAAKRGGSIALSPGEYLVLVEGSSRPVCSKPPTGPPFRSPAQISWEGQTVADIHRCAREVAQKTIDNKPDEVAPTPVQCE